MIDRLMASDGDWSTQHGGHNSKRRDHSQQQDVCWSCRRLSSGHRKTVAETPQWWTNCTLCHSGECVPAYLVWL